MSTWSRPKTNLGKNWGGHRYRKTGCRLCNMERIVLWDAARHTGQWLLSHLLSNCGVKAQAMLECGTIVSRQRWKEIRSFNEHEIQYSYFVGQEGERGESINCIFLCVYRCVNHHMIPWMILLLQSFVIGLSWLQHQLLCCFAQLWLLALPAVHLISGKVKRAPLEDMPDFWCMDL